MWAVAMAKSGNHCPSLVRRVLAAVVVVLAFGAPLAAAPKQPAARSVAWKVTEVGADTLHGTWTWDKEHKRFVGRWSNDAVSHLRVRRMDEEKIVLTRVDREGPTTGLKARYVGDRRGRSFAGTVEWTWNGRVTQGTWQSTPLRRAAKSSPGPGNRPVEDAGGRREKRPVSRSSARPAVRLDRQRYLPERRRLESPAEKKHFPHLGTNYEVLAPSTPYQGTLKVVRRENGIAVRGPAAPPARRVYNCIAHSLGIHNGWVNPETATNGFPLARMDAMYRTLGYVRLRDLDFRRVPGKQKVVVYATRTSSGSIKKVTHAAVQDRNGTWTSKLGKLALIRHLTPQALSGPSYGEPVAVYARPDPRGGNLARARD